MGTAAFAAGGLLGGCAVPSVFARKEPSFYNGALLHLGSNMWGDFPDDPDACLDPFVGPEGKPVSYRSYLKCRDELWKRSVDRMAERKMNFVVIDCGEGIEYPSHPELQVKGTWSVEKTRRELDRIRSLGMTPVPKLNFSTCHDAWLKQYHRMVSTSVYYRVAADIIRDTAEIFDRPPLFHLGFDEEVPIAGRNHFSCICRQGDLWWHDLGYMIGEAERNGSRAVIWADKVCDGREEFLRRMSKDVLLSPWYYGKDFSDKNLAWDEKSEKSGTWAVHRNLAASVKVLADAGFDLLPCTSNWSCDEAAEAMVRFCRERIDPKRLKGLYTAPWCMSVPDDKEGKHGISKTLAGLDLFADAMARHYRDI